MYYYSPRQFKASSGFVADFFTTKLDDERVFIAWAATSGNSRIKASVISYHGNNSIDLAPTASFGPSSGTQAIEGCVKISTDKVALIYTDSTVSSALRIVICTISGTTITFGTVQTVETPGFDVRRTAAICSPSTDKVAIIYGSATTISLTSIKLIAGTVSGTVVTFGSAVTEVTGTTIQPLAICSPSTDKILYTHNNTADYVLRARTLTGTTVNAAGTALTLADTSVFNYRAGFAVLNTDTILGLLFLENATITSQGVYAKYYTLSGTTITEVTSSLVEQNDVAVAMATALSNISSTQAVFNYGSDRDDTGKTGVITYSTTLQVTHSAAYETSEAIESSEASIDYMADGASIMSWRDSTGGFFQLATIDPLHAFETKRSVVGDLLVSWKKDFNASIRLFAIGVSAIGGNDIIAPSEQIDSQWNKYKYFDESQYLLDMEWEQSLSMPQGGISVGMAAASLDNTSGRFTPRYMGGVSELFTAILPRRPFIMNAGFETDDVEITYPQFVGLFDKQPGVDVRSKRLDVSGVDFVNFLQNRYVDDEAMFTGYRSDELIEQILQTQGFTTAQYDLDVGINRINFAIFKRGERFGSIIDEIAKAEYAQFYQAEDGILKFENRQHWDSDTDTDFLLLTSQVLEAYAPKTDHIVNVVEIKAEVRGKQPEQTVFRLATFNSVEIAASGTTELFVDFENPILALTNPSSSSTTSYYKANTESDGSGTDVSSSIGIARVDRFSNSAKITFNNSTGAVAHITELVITGRSAPVQKNIYYRAQDDSSVTAYEERPLVIENDYIQDETWAQSFAQMILNDFGEPENLQTVRVRAIPQLQLGDLVSWQGGNWRVFSKSSMLNTSDGFVQDLELLRREIVTYFRIGISTIGSADRIAP